MAPPSLGEGQIAKRSPTANNGGDRMEDRIIRGNSQVGTVPSTRGGAALGTGDGESGASKLKQ